MELPGTLQGLYVRNAKRLGSVAARTPVLRRLEASDRTSSRWARSLFAVGDIDEMVRLDLAWWTFDAMAAIDALLGDRTDARVLEFGSGASTAWLSDRAGHVVSIEHDANWAPVVEATLADRTNVDLRVVPPAPSASPSTSSEKRGWDGWDFTDYVHAADDVAEGLDLVVIDGRCRAACCAAAVGKLADDGVVLFDDAGRERYRAAIDTSGLAVAETAGLAACLPYRDRTALLAKDRAVLDAIVGS